MSLLECNEQTLLQPIMQIQPRPLDLLYNCYMMLNLTLDQQTALLETSLKSQMAM